MIFEQSVAGADFTSCYLYVASLREVVVESLLQVHVVYCPQVAWRGQPQAANSRGGSAGNCRKRCRPWLEHQRTDVIEIYRIYWPDSSELIRHHTLRDKLNDWFACCRRPKSPKTHALEDIKASKLHQEELDRNPHIWYYVYANIPWRPQI